MNRKICDYVARFDEPDFFRKVHDTGGDGHDAADEAAVTPPPDLNTIHAEIKRGIETATEVITIEIDPDTLQRAEARLTKIGWTVEEACVLFLYWILTCPDKAKEWHDAHGPDDGSG